MQVTRTEMQEAPQAVMALEVMSSNAEHGTASRSTSITRRIAQDTAGSMIA